MKFSNFATYSLTTYNVSRFIQNVLAQNLSCALMFILTNHCYRFKLKDSESKQVAIAKLAKEILEKDKDKDQRLFTLGEENLQLSRVCSFVRLEQKYFKWILEEKEKKIFEMSLIAGLYFLSFASFGCLIGLKVFIVSTHNHYEVSCENQVGLISTNLSNLDLWR